MRRIILLPALLIQCCLYAQQEKIDLDMMQKIRNEGLNHSQVMEIAFYLTDASGPRLMQSPGYFRAANWAKGKFTEWGLENASLEPWGDWGKGWELQKFYLALTSPYYKPLIAFPKTWTNSTDGLQQVEVLVIDPRDTVALEGMGDQLKGKIILPIRSDTLKPTYSADATRFTDEDLQKMADYEPGKAVAPAQPVQAQRVQPQFTNKQKEFLRDHGVIAVLSTSSRNGEGTVFVQGGGQFGPTAPVNFLDIALAYEDYMTIQRLVLHHIPIKLDIDVKSRFIDSDLKGYNVIAEFKGTDKSLKDQLVMLGGHLDSWQGATGATDNAAGSAAVMEAIRILKAVGFKPRRTIRIALWGGEETGLHGSRNYVKNHFTDTTTRRYNAAGDQLSVYLNLDNGSGKIRGIYLQGNANAKQMFSQWFEPFHDLGASTLTLQNTGGTDHLSFDAVGLPAFQFIQDPIEYGSRTHHTNMDSYDHLQAEDLKQAATIIAAFVYDAAQRDEKVPRKGVVAK